ncbi:MAG: hypothetical protein ACE5K4_01455 [Candidatus Hydrothermarchaeota archaeon]
MEENLEENSGIEKKDLAKLCLAFYLSSIPFVVYKHIKQLEEEGVEEKVYKIKVEEPEVLTFRDFVEIIMRGKKAKKTSAEKLVEFLLRKF